MTFSEDSGIIPIPSSQPDSPAPIPSQRRRKEKGPRWLRRSRKLIKHIKWRTLAIVAVTIITVVIVAGLVLVADASNRVQSSLSSLERVVQGLRSRPGTELTLLDFNRLQASATDLSNNLETARNQIGFAKLFARLNPEIDAYLATINSAYHLTLAANEMLKGLQPTIFFLVAGNDKNNVVTSAASGNRIVELMQIGQGSVFTAKGYLEVAQDDISKLDLKHLSAGSVLNVEGLIQYRQQLLQINNLLMVAPDLLTAVLGLSKEQHYLILSQNNDEIRPSGGYISTFGWLTIRNGRITDYGYSPTTATSPNPPPAAMAAQIQVPDWWISYGEPIYAAWDGSWSADFPTTADMSMWYYNNGNNPQSPVDGVIAIDISGFEYLLKALGSVTLSDYDVVVTPENFRHVVYEIRADGEGDLPHKRFLAALYQQIFAQWQDSNADPQIRERLIGAILQALQEKHIMLHFADANLNEATDLLGWSGAQSTPNHNDYLMVVDANLGNKSNHSISRDLTYDVDIQSDGTVKSRLTVSYDYSKRVAAEDPAVNPKYHGPLDYDNLLQVFLSPGSIIDTTTNFSPPPKQLDTTSHTNLISEVTIPYDSSERFQLIYHTLPLIETIGNYHRYRLLIQKQPGTIADAISLQVSLPTNAKILNISPPQSASYSLDRPVLEFGLNLTSDVWIEIVYAS